MWMIRNVLLCSFVVVVAPKEVNFMADRPFVKAKISERVMLECCYTPSTVRLNFMWVRHGRDGNGTQTSTIVELSDAVLRKTKRDSEKFCGTLTFMSVQLDHTGLYQCLLNKSDASSGAAIFSHGTYLLVYKPLEKTFDLNENTKNNILTAQGILLLLVVLLLSIPVLCKSKEGNSLEKKKGKKEEENIYQGLNLDDCCSTYDQIERSQVNSPYQDVCNTVEQEEEIQLEKP
ncbi:uncharacterized protein V6R79_016154 [Siganus canaliculatus]